MSVDAWFATLPDEKRKRSLWALRQIAAATPWLTRQALLTELIGALDALDSKLRSVAS